MAPTVWWVDGGCRLGGGALVEYLPRGVAHQVVREGDGWVEVRLRDVGAKVDDGDIDETRRARGLEQAEDDEKGADALGEELCRAVGVGVEGSDDNGEEGAEEREEDEADIMLVAEEKQEAIKMKELISFTLPDCNIGILLIFWTDTNPID